jgi:hypothetical protein
MWVLSYGMWSGLVLHKYIDVSEDRITSTLDSENGGCNFLRNVTELLPNCTASQPRRLCPNSHWCENFKSNYSSVGIATSYGAGRQSDLSSSPGRGKIFRLSTSFRPVLGPTQPPLQRVPGALSAGVKLSEREAENSPPTSAEVKNTWVYTSTPPYVFMA